MADASLLESASGSKQREARRESCVAWQFWATAAWAAVATGMWFLSQFVIGLTLITQFEFMTPAAGNVAAANAVFISLVTILSAPAPVAVIALVIRLARCQFADYLALTWPRGRDILMGLLCLIVLLPLGDLASHVSGRDVVPPFVVETYKGARDAGALVLLLLAMVVAAPLMEELLFRGFIMRGFSASRLGAIGAIIVTSATWALLHVQYEVFFVVQIFLLGLVFGWLRWRSGSTTLTLLLHALTNFSVIVQTALIVEWMP